MDPSHEKANAVFQGELDSLHDGATLQLLPREFPGPVAAKHPLILDGEGATIWALKGPVVSVHSAGVVLRNLRIEYTGEGGEGRAEDECALLVMPGCGILLENVEVRGSVIGLQEEEGEWRYPYSLQLGQLAYGNERDFIVRVAVPVPCRITSNISGLEIQPRSLKAGTHELCLHVERLPQDTLLNGSLSISTAFLVRRMMLSAHITSSQAGHPAPAQGVAPVVWEPDDWSALVAGPAPQPAPPPVISVQPSQPHAPAGNTASSPPRYIEPPDAGQTAKQSPAAPPSGAKPSLPPPASTAMPPPVTTTQPPAPPPSQPAQTTAGTPATTPPATPPTSTGGASEHPSKTRRIQSTPLSPLFSPAVKTNESGQAEAEAAATSPNAEGQKGTAQLSPLFLDKGGDTRQTEAVPQSAPATPEQKTETGPQESQGQGAPAEQPRNARPAPQKQVVRFTPASSIFGKATPPAEIEEKEEKKQDKEETKQSSETEPGTQPKRKIVSSTSLSPLFGDVSNTGRSDKDS